MVKTPEMDSRVASVLSASAAVTGVHEPTVDVAAAFFEHGCRLGLVSA